MTDDMLEAELSELEELDESSASTSLSSSSPLVDETLEELLELIELVELEDELKDELDDELIAELDDELSSLDELDDRSELELETLLEEGSDDESTAFTDLTAFAVFQINRDETTIPTMLRAAFRDKENNMFFIRTLIIKNNNTSMLSQGRLRAG